MELYTEQKAAELLNISKSTLVRMRGKGEAPPHVTLGRKSIRYPSDSLQQWISARTEAEVE